MEVERPNRTKTAVAAALVLVVLLGATVAYYALALNQSTTSDDSAITSLKSSVASLEENNQALLSEVSTLGLSSTSPASNSTAQQIYQDANQSVVTIAGSRVVTVQVFFQTEESVENVLGSGFVMSYGGSDYIVTNYHVVQGDSNITVTFEDGDEYAGTVVGTDPYSDLAILTVAAPASELHPLDVVSSATVGVGEPVYVIGNPYGLSGSITFGIVSQVGRVIVEDSTTEYTISNIIQFSAPINPGNSGGPLLNSFGQVLGITTAEVNGSQGLGFAIPSDTILQELPSLISTGTYDGHAYLGVTGVDMNLQVAEASGVNVTYGVLVESVAAGSPAAGAGIVAGSKESIINGNEYLLGGDIIVSVNGTKVANTDDLLTYLEANTVAGQTVQLGIIRSGSLVTVDVKLGSIPSS